jgi:hypothetical protein
MEYNNHFRRMTDERAILPEWVQRAIHEPQKIEDHEDGTRHYLCQIAEFEDRWLRAIANIRVSPEKGVTTFFDRRLRRTT